MAVAIGRSFSIQPRSFFNSKSLDRASPAGRLSWLGHAAAAATPYYRQTCVAAQHLAGDFGFDPLGLAEDPASLRWYVQAELVHCRFAMLGVFGILVTDLLRVTGINKIPVWFEAGAVKYDFANTKTLFLVQLLLMGFVETKTYMDFVSPGSQAKEGSFFGLEASLKGLEPGKHTLCILLNNGLIVTGHFDFTILIFRPLRVLLFSSRKYSMNYVAWAYP
ncbi:hypothetical protein JHK87_008857 [Glycine soja]|nr:hypothetical protein JHK87_008857 [Glycine soja]